MAAARMWEGDERITAQEHTLPWAWGALSLYPVQLPDTSPWDYLGQHLPSAQMQAEELGRGPTPLTSKMLLPVSGPKMLLVY